MLKLIVCSSFHFFPLSNFLLVFMAENPLLGLGISYKITKLPEPSAFHPKKMTD